MDDYRNVCYLIHFDEPVSGVQHYLGFTTDLRRRISQHRSGEGALLLNRANIKGVGWRVVRVWRDADLDAEAALKAMIPKNLCPHCNKRVARQKARADSLHNRVQGRPSPT